MTMAIRVGATADAGRLRLVLLERAKLLLLLLLLLLEARCGLLQLT